MISLALAALLVCQDPVETHLKLLSDKDPAVREAATVELMKTPFDKLPLVEKRLKDPDADVAARAGRVIRHVLAFKLGSRKARFEMRPLAMKSVMDEWVEAGADLKKLPKGHEAVTYAEKAEMAPGYEREWVLVEPSVITQDDIKEAQPEPDMGFREMQWLIRIEMKPEGATRFDKAAGEMFKRAPRGQLAILFDGKIISAPTIQSERFNGNCVVQGSHSEVEARNMARILAGNWLESSMRADREKEGAAPPEKTIEFMRGFKGLEKVTIKPDSAGLDITGFLDIKEVDLLALWQSLRERGYRLVPKK